VVILQGEVFDEVEPVVRSVMTGCRLCVFAYGQTGRWEPSRLVYIILYSILLS